MAFTMHSHSGQFCPGHAKDELEDIVKHAIRIGYKTMGLTEHMPRIGLEDLYPEELADPAGALQALMPRHAAYLAEAQRLQAKYAGQLGLLVGFEAEFVRPAEYAPLVRRLAAHPAVDYVVGSLHHACGVPIDVDAALYARARAAAGGSEQRLHARYYDELCAMLAALRPRVVGHFDLVRLLSSDPGRDVRAAWPGSVADGSGETVWDKVVRSLEAARRHGAWLECNSSALRKGLAEPYPARPIAEQWLRMGGKFTMSDDSHGMAQVATNYGKALAYLQDLGVTEVWTLKRASQPGSADAAKGVLTEVSVTLDEFRKSLAR